jgi:hypothetical protein
MSMHMSMHTIAPESPHVNVESVTISPFQVSSVINFICYPTEIMVMMKMHRVLKKRGRKVLQKITSSFQRKWSFFFSLMFQMLQYCY